MRRNFAVKSALIFGSALLLIWGCDQGQPEDKINFFKCLHCHTGIEKISPNHDFECVSCHIRPELRSAPVMETHDDIQRNPSDPLTVRIFCMPCHVEEIENVDRSLHGTVAGIINQTRYLWGAQESAVPAVYGLSGPFRPLPVPDPGVYPETSGLLADDFLRRRCLRCHIHSRGQSTRGLYRASGCAACHVLYNNEGQYRGNDKALENSPQGYPERHELTINIPNEQCLHCHNQNHVGSDFLGLFEKDYNSTYRLPDTDERPPSFIYGTEHHHLAKDIHCERGLWCIDCHGKRDVMGGERAYSYQLETPKTTCSDCHGGFSREGPDFTKDPVREAIKREFNEALDTRDFKKINSFILVSRNAGKKHQVPLFRKYSRGHGIEEHGSVRCSACHAQWSFQDYGLSVIREDITDGYKWYRLSMQGDPELGQKLRDNFFSGKTSIVSKDLISGDDRLGIWLKGWRFRRWEFMPMGKDQLGMYAILRPLYQYLISYVDKLGNVPVDSSYPMRGDKSGIGWSFSPYVPHTVSPVGRSCDSCHGNRISAGLGMAGEMTEDTVLTIPSPPAINAMRLLSTDEQDCLMNPSMRWRKERLKALIK